MTDIPPVPSVAITSTTCPACGKPVPPEFSFCPNCGKQLKDKSLSTTILMQAWLYFMSVFLPPLGLWPGIKYFKSNDPKTQQIGMIVIVLTVLSTIITIWLSFKLVGVYTDAIYQATSGTGGF